VKERGRFTLTLTLYLKTVVAQFIGLLCLMNQATTKIWKGRGFYMKLCGKL
jgi:hypothetical protein